MTLDEFLSWQAVGKLIVLIVVISMATSLVKETH
jgi:hypothetical protein